MSYGSHFEKSYCNTTPQIYTSFHFLQKHYAEVMTKFRKFQRPVDFEPKLSHVKRQLDEIEERIHLIEIRSEDPEQISGQLEHCMVRL